ncbi:50S ribosomal protein L32e [Methanimicrococcus blatticola]|uniref:Large ribosomal subunit protein eL32 n=1 Tax=Methanimicrococcus blatticola TaxID=91560 RepID=A0A484F6X5_9EURY|nr:50S ribosomal protein L32e [Methanimicrococcus blatticola]MBZ3936260.1 50S ribosomal protein L32e [Methanimicrococcus blatticola]MCC2508263.1 50S ribosomal protein L32e [Methanimicrococcus blatticola]TDQ70282.1 LSU ribosomal protein L32E [Methanimicrococcus blatticola]
MTEENIQETVENVNADAPAVSTNLLDADPEIRRLFKVRKVQKGKKPSFHKQNHHKFKRLTKAWRRPRGLQSKQRRGYLGKGAIATVGYGSPVLTKGLHPSGYDEILVYNVDDLVLVDPEYEAVRIGGTVGGKKKAAIVAKAKEFNIKVLNPGKEE